MYFESAHTDGWELLVLRAQITHVKWGSLLTMSSSICNIWVILSELPIIQSLVFQLHLLR